MNNLKQYILEKLHINKNTEINTSKYKNIIDKIYLMCDSEVINGTEIGDITKDVIEKWVHENNVETFCGYGNKQELFDIGMYEDTIKLFTDCRDGKLERCLENVKHNKVKSIPETSKSSGRDFYYDDKFFVLVTSSNNKNTIKVFLKTNN